MNDAQKFLTGLLMFTLFVGGLLLGIVLCDRHHENLYREVKAEAAHIELRLLELEDDIDEIIVLEYFLDETYQDLENLGYALERLIYTGPRGTMTLDRSMFRVSGED